MNQRLRTEDVDSPLCVVRPVKTVMMVVLTGDRGLCGGYNNFILKKVPTGALRAHAAAPHIPRSTHGMLLQRPPPPAEYSTNVAPLPRRLRGALHS